MWIENRKIDFPIRKLYEFCEDYKKNWKIVIPYKYSNFSVWNSNILLRKSNFRILKKLSGKVYYNKFYLVHLNGCYIKVKKTSIKPPTVLMLLTYLISCRYFINEPIPTSIWSTGSPDKKTNWKSYIFIQTIRTWLTTLWR